MEPYKKQQYNGNPSALQKAYEKTCLDKFIYAEPEKMQGTTGQAYQYFDIDLNNLRNFRHAYLFTPTIINAVFQIPTGNLFGDGVHIPLKLFVYIQEQNQLDSPIAYNEKGVAYSNLIMSYSLKIGGQIPLQYTGGTSYPQIVSLEYIPDDIDLKTPFYFQENSKRRFYITTVPVLDNNDFKEYYDRGVVQWPGAEGRNQINDMGAFFFMVSSTNKVAASDWPVDNGLPARWQVKIYPRLKFAYINLEEEIDNQMTKNDI